MAENITLESIGEACGVSPITASRALRGLGNVKPETAKRIRDYAEKIGYKPNPIARSLARSRNGQFHLASTRSIIAPYNELNASQRMPLFWDYIDGAVSAAALKKSSIEVMGFSGGHVEFDFIRTLVEEERVAGVLDFSLKPETIAYLLSKKVPLVTRYSSVHGLDVRRNASVYPDHIQGYLMAWRHLLDCGHERIGYIVREGHRLHLNECIAASHLIPEMPKLEQVIWLEKNATTESITERLVAELGQWKNGGWPTVFFCSNDEVAHLTVVALTEAGLAVPEDVSIFGFDDTGASRFCNPPITTLRNPRAEIGAAMVHLLNDIIAGRPNSRNRIEILPMELVVRKSVRKIKGGAIAKKQTLKAAEPVSPADSN